MNNGAVHGKRFFIWAGHPPAKAQTPFCANRPFDKAVCPDRRASRPACRSFCNRVCTGLAAPINRPGPLGAGSRVPPRKRAHLYSRFDRIWHQPRNFTGHGQPPARRAMDDGGRRRLRRAVCCCRRNPRGTSGAGLYGNKTACHAGRSIRRAGLSDPQRRPRNFKRRPREVAASRPAIPAPPARQPIPRAPAVGRRTVSRPQPSTGPMGGAI